VRSAELAAAQAQLDAAVSLPLTELAALPCRKGPKHRWSAKTRKCKACGMPDLREPATTEPEFDAAEHRAAVHHAILTGQVLG
jgi:hypothetical protein